MGEDAFDWSNPAEVEQFERDELGIRRGGAPSKGGETPGTRNEGDTGENEDYDEEATSEMAANLYTGRRNGEVLSVLIDVRQPSS